ncbi:hypothetical protein PIB30_100819, partial [Stylosanthes scabra]|nr:hypothetical protein [Stylosanthes scabra]
HSWAFSKPIIHARASASLESMDKLAFHVLAIKRELEESLATTPIPTVSSSMQAASTLIFILLVGGLLQFFALRAPGEGITIKSVDIVW